MLVNIKADLLKNCPHGFMFFSGGIAWVPIRYTPKMVVAQSVGSNREHKFFRDTLVQVYADRYRDACIRRIEAVTGRALRLTKLRTVSSIAVVTERGLAFSELDPWPHLEVAEWDA